MRDSLVHPLVNSARSILSCLFSGSCLKLSFCHKIDIHLHITKGSVVTIRPVFPLRPVEGSTWTPGRRQHVQKSYNVARDQRWHLRVWFSPEPCTLAPCVDGFSNRLSGPSGLGNEASESSPGCEAGMLTAKGVFLTTWARIQPQVQRRVQSCL
jgi:hypothetical protein